MNDVEAVARRELERLVPPVPEAGADWPDVVRRADRRGRRRREWIGETRKRPLVLVGAVLLAAALTAGAVAAAVGGFDSWLRGDPGTPASAEEQARFRAANERSWAGFPAGTELRELIRGDAEGHPFVLHGFRSGRSLCLRLTVEEFRPATTEVCAPASVLERPGPPIVVATAETSYFDRRNRPAAQASFGFAADGVERVTVDATDGIHRALVGGNAYVHVQHEPNSYNRVLAISAVDRAGERTTIRLDDRPDSPFGTTRPEGPLRGPDEVEATIESPRVGWHERGELRGVAPDEVPLTAQQRRDLHMLGALRLVKPDPSSDTVVGLAGGPCLVVMTGFDGGGGASCFGDDFFPQGALNWMMAGRSTEFFTIAGAAADGVERIEAFLTDGTREPVPLRDNLYAITVGRDSFPLRLVAYDHEGRVVASMPHRLQGPRTPPPARELRPVENVTGPNGTVATLHLGPEVDRHRCWRLTFTDGRPVGRCTSPFSGPILEIYALQPAGGDLFVSGWVRDDIEAVRLEFADGETRSVRPVTGFYLLAIPAKYLTQTRQRAEIVAVNGFGDAVSRWGLHWRMR